MTDQLQIDCEECAAFPGRLKDLCLGFGLDGRPDPPRKSANAFRAKRGLAALPDLPPRAGGGSEHLRDHIGSGAYSRAVSIASQSTRWDVPGKGRPGHHLTTMFTELGQTYQADSTCNCQETARLMDTLGVNGCRQRANDLVAKIEANAATLSLWEKLKIGVSIVAKGFPLTAAGLFHEAIRRAEDEVAGKKTWAYGITTTPMRRHDLLPQTLRSLAAAGFPDPHLFVDGSRDSSIYISDDLPVGVTHRWPNVGNFANWTLSLWELFARNPNADFYAIFEDDILASLNLREYLERTPVPADGYRNLYSWPVNEKRVRPEFVGWSYSNQRGLGACGLVFTNEQTEKLLAYHSMVHHPKSEKAKTHVDGAVLHAMSFLGFMEYTHNPSLLQHVGLISSMGNEKQPQSRTFRGEQFDLLKLVPT